MNQPQNQNIALNNSEIASNLNLSIQDVIDAVAYGFFYREESQNDGVKVPDRNVMQWLIHKKKLKEVPEEITNFLKQTETNN